MDTVFVIIQIISALALAVLILIQNKGTGLGRTFGGGGGITSFKRRGLEKIIFRSTFVVAGIFLSISILLIYF